MDECAVKLDKYSYSAGRKVILDKVSLELRKGEHLAVIGPNGAGKSTLLKCIIGINRGGEGEIIVDGRPLVDYSTRELSRLVCYVPQAQQRYVPYTVEQYLLLARYNRLGPFQPCRPEDRQAVNAAAVSAGIDNLLDRRFDTLSGGERQVAEIAAAIAQQCKIMLLDEPTTFLDPSHEHEVKQIISAIRARGDISIITVTHDIDYAAAAADRVLCLRDGAVFAAVESSRLMDEKLLDELFGIRFTFAEHPLTGRKILVKDN